MQRSPEAELLGQEEKPAQGTEGVVSEAGGKPAGEGFSQPRKRVSGRRERSTMSGNMRMEGCPWVWPREGRFTVKDVEDDSIGVLAAGLALNGVERKEWEGGGGASEERCVWMGFALTGGELRRGTRGSWCWYCGSYCGLGAWAVCFSIAVSEEAGGEMLWRGRVARRMPADGASPSQPGLGPAPSFSVGQVMLTHLKSEDNSSLVHRPQGWQYLE